MRIPSPSEASEAVEWEAEVPVLVLVLLAKEASEGERFLGCAPVGLVVVVMLVVVGGCVAGEEEECAASAI